MKKPHQSGHGETGTITTWSWRLTRERYLSHEAVIVDRAKHGDIEGLKHELECLTSMPMFAGIRQQLFKLHAEAVKVWRKFNQRRANELAPLKGLPYMVRIAVYDRPPQTAWMLTQSDK